MRTSDARTRQVPWAVVLAAVAVLAIDVLALGRNAPFEWFERHLGPDALMERGTVLDRLQLRRAGSNERETRPLVFVLGSSRIQEGFRPQQLERSHGRYPLHFVELAHCALSPLEIRAMVPALLEKKPALVVIGLSEFDTSSKVRLTPGTSYHSYAALRDIFANADARTLFERRQGLYRIALASTSNLYHYRRVIGQAGLDSLRRFARPEEAPPLLDDPDEGIPTALGSIVRHFDELHPERPAEAHPALVRLARRVGRGPDAQVLSGLVRSAISELRNAGVAVTVVELPIFPGLEVAYDSSTRLDFRALMRELVADQGIGFIPLAEQPPYLREDFKDPIHLGETGSPKLTRVIVVSSLRLLDDGKLR